MNPERLKKILTQVREGKLTVDGALKSLKHLPFEDIDFARIDHHRSLRKGFPRGDLRGGQDGRPGAEDRGPGWPPQGENILVTPLDPTKARTILKKYPRPSIIPTPGS